MNGIRVSELRDMLRPFWLQDLQTRSVTAGTSSAMLMHSYGLHSDTIPDGHAPQFAKLDGSRLFTGNIAFVGAQTVDGVDVSAHAANANAHHNQSHVLATTSGLGGDHTVSGLTTGQVLRATGATTAAFGSLLWSEINKTTSSIADITTRSHSLLTGIGANDHHNQVHGIVGGDHTVTGALLDVVGLTGSNTLGILTPSAAPGAASAILKSDSSGKLTLPLLVATTSITTPSLITASGDLSVTPAGSNISVANSKTLKSNYVSGWAGSGWQIDSNVSLSGESFAEFDNLSVRGTMRVYELLINQIRATNGTLIVSSAGKIDSVSGSNWTFEDPEGSNLCPFLTNDLVIIQNVDLDASTIVKRIVRRVTVVSGKTITVTAASGGPTDAGSPAKGDTVVRFGNSTNAARQGVVLITSDFTNSPYMDVVSGVTSWADWTGGGKTKVRLGNLTGITGTANEYGLIAGSSGFTSADSYVKFSSAGVLQNNVNSAWTSGGTSFLTIDATNGLNLASPPTSIAFQRAYSFTTSGTESGGLYHYIGASNDYLGLHQLRASRDNIVGIEADGDATHLGRIDLYALGKGDSAHIQLNAGVSSDAPNIQFDASNITLSKAGDLWVDGIIEAGYNAISGNLSQATFRYSTAAAISLASTVWGYASHIGFNAYMADRSASYAASGAWEYVGAQYTGNITAPGRLTWDGNANAFYFAIGETGLATGDPITSWTTALSVSANSMDWRANTDNTATFGRATIGYLGYSDHAGFAHYDMASAGNYALLQNATGATFLNSASGQRTRFRINNVAVGNLGATGLRVGDDSSATEMLDVVGNATISGSLDAASFAASWTTLSYNTNWSSYGGAYGAVKYCRIGDWVIVNGMAKRSAGSAEATIATLPSGYRPTVQKSWYTTFSVGSVESAAKIEVTTSGTIAVTAGGTSAIDYVSLDCIQFRTNS